MAIQTATPLPESTPGPSQEVPLPLKRALGLWLLVFYGLGTIIGAGIYVLVGEVAGKAGMAAPLSFLLAGLLAGLTGLCYADLAARFPEAAGAAAYVGEGWRSPILARLVGFLVLIVGIVLAASLARGAAGYLETFIVLPPSVAAGGFVLAFTAIACLGVRESVGIASLMTIIELAGLVLVVAAGGSALGSLPDRMGEVVPDGPAGWLGVGAGGFIAFFAFLGFESLANMGDEAKDASRTLPRAIILSIVISTIAYVLVSLVAVLAVPADQLARSTAPLGLVLETTGWKLSKLLSIIALIAVPGGILIDVVMSSRLLYGMARRGLLPAWLAQVDRRNQVPLAATLTAGGVTFVFAVAVPFSGLVTVTSSLTLLVFLSVNTALWRLQLADARHGRSRQGFRAPRWVAPLAAALSLALIVAEVVGRSFV